MPNPNEARQAIAIRLRAAREQAGLSQAEAADLLGYTQQAISLWEKGIPPKEAYWKFLILKLKENYGKRN